MTFFWVLFQKKKYCKQPKKQKKQPQQQLLLTASDFPTATTVQTSGKLRQRRLTHR